jgi:hypothetical protein
VRYGWLSALALYIDLPFSGSGERGSAARPAYVTSAGVTVMNTGTGRAKSR